MAKDFPCRECGVAHPIGQHVPPSQRMEPRRAGQTAAALKKLERLAAPKVVVNPTMKPGEFKFVKEPVAGLGEAPLKSEGTPVMDLRTVDWSQCPNCAAARAAAAERKRKSRKGKK